MSDCTPASLYAVNNPMDNMRRRRHRSVKVLACLTGAITCVMSLTACEERPLGPDMQGAYYDPALKQNVDSQLTAAAQEAVAGIRTLDLVERAKGPAPAPEIQESAVPPALLAEMTEINWSGPVEPLLSDLAHRAGYAWVPPLHTPVTPAMVSLSSNKTTVAKALEDVGLQIDKFATIVVDPNKQSITLRYDDQAQHIDPPPHHNGGPPPHARHHSRPADHVSKPAGKTC